jgi:hypothetical protein
MSQSQRQLVLGALESSIDVATLFDDVVADVGSQLGEEQRSV